MALQYTWWQTENFFVGYLNDFPDYETQGQTLSELQENLTDLYKDIAAEEVPFVRHVSELVIA